ncbi:hypothetical protein SUGI_1092390 [Cryptomeria japonica]|nr:hypothetical protein SUGI_1092390 [Cryptomeria japonica]
MASKNQAVNELEIQIVDSEERHSWFDNVKGKFEFHKPEDDKPDDSSGKLPPVSINRVPMMSQTLSQIELKKLFTLDGCFILETLRLLTDESRWNPSADSGWNLDPVLNRNRVQSSQFDIFTNLLMLENQVPMVVLIQLLEMEENLTEETARTQLLRMICDGIIALAHPFSYSMQRKTGEPLIEHKEREAKVREDLKSKYRNLKEYSHILGFFHDFIVNESETTHGEEQTQDVNITVPEGRHHSHFDGSNPCRILHDRRKESDNRMLRASATELNNKGIKFKAYEGVPSAMELRFDKKKETLFLPVIWVSDATEMIFRNLKAVDVCQEKELTVISEYVFLMNSLIKFDKDVALLRKKGVIQNSIRSDEEATDLFNSLCKGINFTLSDEDKLMNLKSDVNNWYRSRTVVKFMRWVETHPKLVQFPAMFWAVILVLASAAPSFGQIIKQFYRKHCNKDE